MLKQISTVSLASILLRCSGSNSAGGCKFRAGAGAGAVRKVAGGGQGVFSGQRWIDASREPRFGSDSVPGKKSWSHGAAAVQPYGRQLVLSAGQR